MTFGTTQRSSVEQYLEPKDDSSSITLDGTKLIWNLPSTRPATYTLNASGLSIPTPDKMVAGMEYTLTLVQDSTGSRTVTWGVCFVWHNGIEPSLSSGAGETDVFKFYSDGVNMYGRHIFKQAQV